MQNYLSSANALISEIYCQVKISLFTKCQSFRLVQTKSRKAFADDNLYVVQVMIYDFDNVENILGKGKSAGYQHFLLSPQGFQ